jgi:hypothetical protein
LNLFIIGSEGGNVYERWLVGGEKQVPFDFAQGRLSRDTAALGMTKFF